MEFQIPTTKSEMFDTLKQIFYYYRYRPILYTGVELEELELPRIEYELPTDEQLETRAALLLSGEHGREIAEAKKQILARIKTLQTVLDDVDAETETLITKLRDDCAATLKKTETEAVKKGIAYSDVVHERITSLEKDKNDGVAEINAAAENKKTLLKSQIAELENEYRATEDYFEPVHRSEIVAKAEELKAEAEKTYREVFKYNNGLYRREKEYANNLVQAKATLEIKFLEIRSGEFSKEELIDMGYYDDVLNCVSGYYDTLEPVAAYKDFAAETRLALYLNDYYQDMLFLYKTRAAG